jgi:hypothetical protein
MKIEVEVSEDNESTDSPWWILIDPHNIREMMEGVAEDGEVPDEKRILTTIAFSIEGPYFSRKEAEDYLKSRKYNYSGAARVWCHSGYRSEHYKNAIRQAREAKFFQAKDAKGAER